MYLFEIVLSPTHVSSLFCLFFFFFQAEDGIRDRDVTGVQTCALPISVRLLKAHPDVPERLAVVGFSFGGTVAALVAGRDSRIRAAVLAAAPAVAGPKFRSEERRVGKEWRSWWSR